MSKPEMSKGRRLQRSGESNRAVKEGGERTRDRERGQGIIGKKKRVVTASERGQKSQYVQAPRSSLEAKGAQKRHHWSIRGEGTEGEKRVERWEKRTLRGITT